MFGLLFGAFLADMIFNDCEISNAIVSGIGSAIDDIFFGGAIKEYLTRLRLRRALDNNGLGDAIVTDLIGSGNVTHVRLNAIDEDGDRVRVEYAAENGVSREIDEGLWV